MSPVFRIGIVGAGEVARRHLDALSKEPGAAFTWVADPSAERRASLAARYGIPRQSASAEDVLHAPDVDLVLVLTPHHLHAPQSIAALRAGKHVFCEKPMARNPAECDAMLEAARQSGRQLHVTHALRAEFFFLAAMERLSSGAIGRPLLGSFRWHTDELHRLEDPSQWKGTVERSGGGVFIDGGCHVADVANAFLGPAVSASARAARLVVRRPEVGEDNGIFTVAYRNGAMAAFLTSFIAGAAFRLQKFGAGMELDLYGTQGHFHGGYLMRDQTFLRFFTAHRPGGPDISVPPAGDLPGIDQLLFRSLRDGAPPPHTALEARNAVAVIEAAYRSVSSGRNERVDWREG